MDLQFFMPTKIYFGQNTLEQNAAEVKKLGTKALIVTGKNSGRLSGALEEIEKICQNQAIDYTVYPAIENNPSIYTVREAAALAKENQVEMIIGCGGGSPLDAAKAIALLATNNLEDQALFSGHYAKPALPIIAIPTTAGTGSEVTQYAILTDDSLKTKRSIAHPTLFPQVAFLDPSYTVNLPLEITRDTVIDALTHSIEGFLSRRANTTSNLLAKESIKIIGSCLGKLTVLPEIATREKLLYASMLAGIVIAHTGTTALHSIGYSLTYFKGIPHGRANGVLLVEYLKFIAEDYPKEVTEVVNLLGLKSIHDLGDILVSFFPPLEDISSEEIQTFIDITMQAKNIHNTLIIPREKDIETILTNSMV